jgi:hypothetical protein
MMKARAIIYKVIGSRQWSFLDLRQEGIQQLLSTIWSENTAFGTTKIGEVRMTIK